MDAVVDPLHSEAANANERRILVLHGTRTTTYEECRRALDGINGTDITVISEMNLLPAEHLPPNRSGELLGRTREIVVVDAHDALVPNVLGRATGAVDGGGLLVLLTPLLDDWPTLHDGFDERLAAPPFSLSQVTGHFRQRLVNTLRAHPGIAIVNVDEDRIERRGLTCPSPRLPASTPSAPPSHTFPEAAYNTCLTTDQVDAVKALEQLKDHGTAVVLEAHRGRGKSSAAGIAAGSLAAEGNDVIVTAPAYKNAGIVFDRAADLLGTLGILDEGGEDDQSVCANGGGCVRFVPPLEARTATADALLVDEAAALPVSFLSEVAEGDRPVAFATTIHGYEGAGRGFAIRFRDHLAETDRTVEEISLTQPIRYAVEDPVEAWVFRTLALDATPAVDQLVTDATPDSATYVTLDPVTLLQDEHRLRDAFGLLVTAHYRTEPNDLARLLDAPNVTVRALDHDGRIVSVALLAFEGNLSPKTRENVYEGGRITGNMFPDVLTSQLRDIDAGIPRGLRIVRIATHHTVRSRGLGTHLLDEIRHEFGVDNPDSDAESVDYLCVGFGATPDLLRFWRENGFRTVHLSTSRNDTSGEHSTLLIDPLSEAGQTLHRRTANWFVRRISDVLTDALDDCNPAVVAETLAATDARVHLDLTDREWRVVAAAAFGPGLYDAAPGPFRRLAFRALVDGTVDPGCEAAQLLVRKTLQGRNWEDVVTALGYASTRTCMQTFGDTYRQLVDTYGTEVAHVEADRYK